MHDFGSFCYLDVQKTGSTFISDFLRRHCAGREVAFKKHGVVSADAVRPGTLYFISARDPVDLYRSLYAYGYGGEGRLRRRLAEVGAPASVYDGTPAGFVAWLGYVLDPANHALLSPKYSAEEAALYGFQTHRFLQLSFADPLRTVRRFRTRADVTEAYARRRLHSTVVRNETLSADLARLIADALHAAMDDPAAARAELAAGPERINASANSAGTLDLPLDAGMRASIAERDWFFADVLGYRVT